MCRTSGSVGITGALDSTWHRHRSASARLERVCGSGHSGGTAVRWGQPTRISAAMTVAGAATVAAARGARASRHPTWRSRVHAVGASGFRRISCGQHQCHLAQSRATYKQQQTIRFTISRDYDRPTYSKNLKSHPRGRGWGARQGQPTERSAVTPARAARSQRT